MTTGWYPRYSPDGSRLTWERPDYWQAQWLTNETEIAHNGVHLLIAGEVRADLAANELSAGAGLWAGWRKDIGVYTSWGRTLRTAGCPTLNPYGVFGYVDDRQADMKTLIWNDQPVSHGAITDVRASRTALVWSASGRTWGLRLDRPEAARDIQAALVEFRPIPIDTPDGPWVLNHTHTGIVLRPYGETTGYRLDNGGQTYYPDATFRNGAIVAIFTNDHGEQTEHVFDLAAPRVSLVTFFDPPHPPDPPLDPPKEPPVSESEIDTITRIRKLYPRSNPNGHPLNEDAWLAISHVAKALGGLVFRKDGGDNAFIPKGLLSKYPEGVHISRTLIGRGVFGNRWFKVFGDGEGTAFPKWELGDTPADGDYVDVSEIVIPGVVNPPPPVDPPPSSDTNVRLTTLEWQMRVLLAKLRSV